MRSFLNLLLCTLLPLLVACSNTSQVMNLHESGVTESSTPPSKAVQALQSDTVILILTPNTQALMEKYASMHNIFYSSLKEMAEVGNKAIVSDITLALKTRYNKIVLGGSIQDAFKAEPCPKAVLDIIEDFHDGTFTKSHDQHFKIVFFPAAAGNEPVAGLSRDYTSVFEEHTFEGNDSRLRRFLAGMPDAAQRFSQELAALLKS